MTEETESEGVFAQLTEPEWRRLWAWMSGESGICPQCRREIERREQIGRGVYASPCGCRLYQGRLPVAESGQDEPVILAAEETTPPASLWSRLWARVRGGGQ